MLAKPEMQPQDWPSTGHNKFLNLINACYSIENLILKWLYNYNHNVPDYTSTRFWYDNHNEINMAIYILHYKKLQEHRFYQVNGNSQAS